MNLQDLTRQDGEDNTGGVQRFLQYARVADITTIPQPTQPSTLGDGSLSDLVTITGNIVMKAYKRFYKIECVLDENQFEGSSQGETNGMSNLQTLEVLISGKKAAVAGFIQYIRNGLGLIIWKDNDGQKYLFGSENYPAKFKSSKYTVPKKAGDRAAAVIIWETVQKGPFTLFNGDIDLTGSGYSTGDAEDLQELIYSS